MALTAKDLIGRVKRPVRSVNICLDGELWAEHDELTAKLDELQKKTSFATMADSGEVKAVAQQLADLEDRMKAAEVTFRFQGISSYKLAGIQARFPSENLRQTWDVQAGAHAVVAASAVEPAFTEDEAKEFFEAASQAVADKLFSVAWLATTGSSDVPFSVRASELIRGSGSK